MKDLLLRARVVVRTSNMKISRRLLANYSQNIGNGNEFIQRIFYLSYSNALYKGSI